MVAGALEEKIRSCTTKLILEAFFTDRDFVSRQGNKFAGSEFGQRQLLVRVKYTDVFHPNARRSGVYR